MLTIFSFLLALAVLIVIHEYGHYQVAKWCGVKVLRFSIGFGRPLFCKQLGEDKTEFVVAGIPLGGYVKMLDERELDDSQVKAYSADLHRAFNRQHVLKRIAIVFAGPLANLILAVALYWLLVMQGITGLVPKLSSPLANSIAQSAGFQKDDMILSVEGKKVETWQDFQWKLMQVLPSPTPISIQVLGKDKVVQNRQLDTSNFNPDQFNENVMQNLGFVPVQPEIPAVIGEIQENSAARKFGLLVGDKINSINGYSVDSWAQLVEFVRHHPGQNVSLEILRSKENLLINVSLDKSVENNVEIGKLGVGPLLDSSITSQMLVTQRFNAYSGFNYALTKTWDTSIFNLKMLFKMITGNASLKTVSGPVTIANFAGQSAHIGWQAYLAFLAVMSVSLGVLNLLPIPILDGGHIVYYTVEIIRGRPLSESLMMVGQKVGFIMLGALMLLALYNDFNRLMTGSF